MIVSLNEIEQTVLKAARGAGFSWGQAEDISRAAHWLALHHLPWDEGLVALLQTPQSPDLPLIHAIALADKAIETLPTTLDGVREPIWIVPFAALAAERGQFALSIEWPGTRVSLSAIGGLIEASGALAHPTAVAVTIAESASGAVATVRPRAGGRQVSDAAWLAVQALEARTYVPASEQSRIIGAGSGISDND